MPFANKEDRKANYEKNKDRVNELKRADRKANPEKYRNYTRKQYKNYSPERKKELIEGSRLYHITHPQKAMLQRARKRAKQQGIPFDITESDIIIPTVCPILNIPLFRGKNYPKGNSPSLDKIIPSKGYIKGNIQIISQRANLMKLDASKEELVKFAKWVLANFDNDDVLLNTTEEIQCQNR